MMKITIISVIALFVASEADAATNPQSIAGGFPFPVYVNGSGTSQSNAEGIYVNQTQFTPTVSNPTVRTLTGVGK